MKHKQVNVLFLFLLTLEVSGDKPCIARHFESTSIVCVCNATYCDTISPIQPLSATQFVVITTNAAGSRFRKTTGTFDATSNKSSSRNIVSIDPDTSYQSIIGWGGAFTDAAGININSLSDGAKDNLLRSYFSNEGIEYNIGRVPMASTDFSTHPYTYDDGKIDRPLKNFQLAPEDYEYKIPLLKQAHNLTNGNLLLLASTWIAPKWMKTNNRYGGRGYIRRDMFQVWANYFLKFLRAYSKEGLQFWGVTTGNEPSIVFRNAIKGVVTVAWTPTYLRAWILESLGPTMRQSEFSDINILVLDDNRDCVQYVPETLSRNASQYIHGISVHWYTDASYSPKVLTLLHKGFPDKFILNTEASIAPLTLGCWEYAEKYALDIIQDLHHWVVGWMDWNIALDTRGGPTYLKNFHDASIIVNATVNEFYKEPMYYTMGHFSKFAPKGSVRIATSKYRGELKIVAFKRPDKGTTITVLNAQNTTNSVVLRDKKRGYINLSVEPKSLNTILYW